MHQLLLITVNMPPDEKSADVRMAVYEELINDSSFFGHGAERFGEAVCDWFSIGGRWSGYLTNATEEQESEEQELGDEYGSPDDAQLLTAELYDTHLLPFVGHTEKKTEGWDGYDYCDLDWDRVSPEMIGKKWLVVVDYHC